MTARIYAIRHGESWGNVAPEDLYVTRTTVDFELTELGRRQARDTRVWMIERGIHPDQVFHSHYLRATETAQIVFPESALREDALLAEIDRGAPRAFVHAELAQQLPWEVRRQSLHPLYHYRPLAGESYADLERRVRQFLLTLALRGTTGVIGVATHDRWMQMLLKISQGWSVREYEAWRTHTENIPNAGVLAFDHVGSDQVEFLPADSSVSVDLSIPHFQVPTPSLELEKRCS